MQGTHDILDKLKCHRYTHIFRSCKPNGFEERRRKEKSDYLLLELNFTQIKRNTGSMRFSFVWQSYHIAAYRSTVQRSVPFVRLVFDGLIKYLWVNLYTFDAKTDIEYAYYRNLYINWLLFSVHRIDEFQFWWNSIPKLTLPTQY